MAHIWLIMHSWESRNNLGVLIILDSEHTSTIGKVSPSHWLPLIGQWAPHTCLWLAEADRWPEYGPQVITGLTEKGKQTFDCLFVTWEGDGNISQNIRNLRRTFKRNNQLHIFFFYKSNKEKSPFSLPAGWLCSVFIKFLGLLFRKFYCVDYYLNISTLSDPLWI